MTFHPASLVPALLLLVFPADRLLPSAVELRDFDSFHILGRQQRHRPWWWVVALWLDPVRAYVGTYLLADGLELKFGRWDVAPPAVLAIAGGILAVALLAQVITFRERGIILAPIGFAIGVLLCVAPWYATGIALTMACVAMFGFRQFFGFFVGGSATIGFLGVVMETGKTWMVLALVAFGTPLLAAMVSGRTLEVPTCKPKGPADENPPPGTRETGKPVGQQAGG